MTISQKIIDQWKVLKEHGDITLISETSGISRPTITDAFKTGQMAEDTYEAIQKFFNAKRARQESLLSKSNPEE